MVIKMGPLTMENPASIQKRQNVRVEKKTILIKGLDYEPQTIILVYVKDSL